MKSKNIDIVRKKFYETFSFFRGKGFTGAEVQMGLWEASGMDLVRNVLKQGYTIHTPSGEELLLEEVDDIQRRMETIYLHGDVEPECFGTKKVRVRKGVPRYECVMCVRELPCMKKYRESKKSKRGKKKKKRKRK